MSDTINYIYHIGDLHIRNLKRHNEYRIVFKKFLSNIKNDNIIDSVIYIGGDIAHAKTDMSPELVREISWFLNECANLRDTFIIAGNHDTNGNNDYRLDVITPIVENLNNTKIHYLKNTGIYEFKNLTFVVYSIFDKKENWPAGTTISGDNKIVLFHGPVNKAETDIGYTVSSNSFTTDMFDGFHIAMLADIHKRQKLQDYSNEYLEIDEDDLQIYLDKDWKVDNQIENRIQISKIKPTISYCGSLIQQNHGEFLEKHGYLLWDIKNRTYKEFDIHNDYGYVTIDIVNGKIPQWVYDEINTKLPKYPKLRIRFNKTNISDTKRCVTELKQLFKLSEITISRTDTLLNLKGNRNLNHSIIGNVRDETFQTQIIKEYLETHYNLEDKDIQSILELNTEVNLGLNNNSIIENVIWYPKEFEFSNMFSYGENNLIRFNNAAGMVGIFAENTAGKSSIIDSLSFCIFDKSSRTFLAKNVLNNRKKQFITKFRFQIHNTDYFIERIGKTVNKGRNVKVDVNFWKEENGVTISLNGEDRRDTNNIIRQYVGTYEDFILTSVSLQGNNALFIDKSQSERKDILAQFIGVDIFDKLYTAASEMNKETATLIKKFKRDDFTSLLAKYEIDLQTKKSEYNVVDTELTNLKVLEDSINNNIVSLNKDLIQLNSDIIDIELVNNTIKSLNKLKSDIKDKKDIFLERISVLESKYIQLDDILDSLNEQNINNGVNTYNKLNSKYTELDNSLQKIQLQLNNLYERKTHLDLHKYNEDCEICMFNAKSILEQKSDVLNNINKLKTEYDSIKLEIDNVLTKIKIYKNYKSDWDYLQTVKSDEIRIDNELTNLLGKVSNLEKEESNLDIKIEINNNLVMTYYKNENQIKHNKELLLKIDKYKEELHNVKINIASLNRNVLLLTGDISTLNAHIKNINDKIIEIKKLEDRYKLFEYYLNTISRDGIPYELITKALPMIESEINNVLSQIVEFAIQLEMDGKNINANIVYDTQKWSLEMSSGMERFISGLAIRIALINICNLPRPNFLVIDEGFGSLDTENLTSLYMLFSYLKTQFDFVIIISHLDSMRDAVDKIIEIKKINGFSSVKF